MKKNITVLFLLVASVLNAHAQKLKYPAARKTAQSDNYFGTIVYDPYRWMEDDRSPETAAWVAEENKVTEKFLSAIPFRAKLKQRLTQLWNFPKWSAPFKAGEHYFVYTNDGLQNQFVLNILSTIDSKPEPFLDPNKLSKDGTVNIPSLAASHDGKYLAYTTSSAGSDWEDIHVRRTDNKTDLPQIVHWVKFSGIAWQGDGFYYSRYDKPDSGNVLKGKNEFHKVYYHKISQEQENDVLVYEDKEHGQRNFGAGVTDDENYLLLMARQGSIGNNLMVKNLRKPNAEFKTLVADFTSDVDVIDNESNMLLVKTNREAPKYKLVWMDAENPAAEWKTCIPEGEDVIEGVTVANHMIVVKYMHDAKSVLKIFSMNGEFVREIPLETIGTVELLSGDKKDENLFYSLITFTSPATIYHYNLRTNQQRTWFQPKMDFNVNDYETKQVFYTSKDGTRVPMFITYKKGIILDGYNPTMLFGYGGFNVSKTPEFKIERLLFLENGGVFAQPNIRGGGEYGETWHEAGTKLKKQNVFDDFIAAAQYLIREKYTSPAKLSIAGRSNGGLLVGAAMTERPELFKVAMPTVGVMDMLRYHKFTIGWAWKGDYGSSEDSVNFRNLYSYSPLHNIQGDSNYPATIVITGDHDDRVVPAHSFKFIATLQEKNTGDNPQLIRVDMNSGHAATTALGTSKPVSKQIDEQADIFTFLFYELGMSVK